MKTIDEYTIEIMDALKAANKFSPGLMGTIVALAGAFKTRDIANRQIEGLDEVTVEVVNKYGAENIILHPVFKIQRDNQETISKLMKSLDLTPEGLLGTDDNDPLIKLTEQLIVTQNNSKILRPTKEPAKKK